MSGLAGTGTGSGAGRTLQSEGDGLLELLELLGECEIPRRRGPGARHDDGRCVYKFVNNAVSGEVVIQARVIGTVSARLRGRFGGVLLEQQQRERPSIVCR